MHIKIPQESSLNVLVLLLLLDLEQQRAVDVRQHAAKSDGSADQRVKLLIAADGQLQVARRDALDFEVLGRVARQFQHFGRQVLEHGGDVDGGCWRENTVSVEPVRMFGAWRGV